MKGLEIVDVPAFADYIKENASDPELNKGIELAQKWGEWTIGLAQQYGGVVESELYPGLSAAQGLGYNAKTGDIEAVNPNNWEQVMRAADILSKFWRYRERFEGWTRDIPYRNGYGNWIDPATRSMIEDPEDVIRLQEERSAA